MHVGLHTVLVPTLLLSLLGFGCDSTPPPVDAGIDPRLDEVRRDILDGIGDRVILPTLRDFADRAAELETSAAAYASDPSDTNRATAQAAWLEAMVIWEQAELMQIGPAGMGGVECPVVGGMDLRDEIYSWDITSECRIDQETVDGAYDDVDLLAAEAVNVRGLDALEYLLFESTNGNDCSALSPINDMGTWAALGDVEVRARRATYAQHAATLVNREAVRLRDLWEPAAGGFETDFANAGEASSAYPSAQSAFNDMGGVMLYLDNQTRDMKLGEPVGIAGCMAATCYEALELPQARVGLASILANLRGFQRLYLGEVPGTAGLGWDDLLNEIGQDTLAAQVATAIEDAITAIEALGADSLQDAFEADPAAVMSAYEAVGLAQRVFKVDVFSALDIEPTSCVPGDND